MELNGKFKVKESEMTIDRRTFLKSMGLAMLGVGRHASLAAEHSRRRPNILFFYPDQHRFDWTSMNPELPDITPNLKRLSKVGIHFRNAISPAPVCAPSRACLASGRDYANCGVSGNGNPYPLDKPTLYQLLRDAGYAVLGCGKFDLDKPGKNWGVDGTHPRNGDISLLEAWGFTAGIDNAGKMDGVSAYKTGKQPEPYFAFLKSRGLVDAHIKNLKTLDHDYEGPSLVPDDAYCDNWIAQNGLKLLRSVPVGKPWFIQVNFNGPHPPMDITKSLYNRFKDLEFPEPREGKGNNPPAKRRNYAAMIWNIDNWLAIYENELKKRGELESTLIVYCSDHGEMLGDRGMGGKSKPYHPSACVPLVVAGPGVRRGVVCDTPVETLDLTATFLDYAGLKPSDEMESKSLRGFLEGSTDLRRRYAVSSLGNWAMVFDGRYKLIATQPKAGKSDDTTTKYVLYDLTSDPVEIKDIAPENPDIVKRLKPLLPPVAPYRNKKREQRKQNKDR